MEVRFRRATNADRATAQRVVDSALREYGLHVVLEAGDIDLTDLEQHYDARGGRFELLETGDGETAGVLGWRPASAEVMELKKLYLAPHARGRGLGRTAIMRVVEAAREYGARCIVLETASVLHEANRLYTRFGFVPVQGAAAGPFAALTEQCDLAYRLDLDTAPVASPRDAAIANRYAHPVSIFDHDEFSRRMFFERRDDSPPPAGASDRMVDGDGARLHVRLHAAPGSAGTLLLFHGNGEVVADYDDIAERFARAGVVLAVMDYRGYGRSTGTSTLRDVISDARVVAEAIRPRVVMGRSLGGLAAHELYARPTAGLAGVILESALFDLGALVRRRGLEPPLAFSAEERATFEPAGKLRLGRLPLLVLHGERDDLIVLDEARATFAHAGTADPDKSLVVVPRRGHNDVSRGDNYWAAIAGFIARLPA